MNEAATSETIVEKLLTLDLRIWVSRLARVGEAGKLADDYSHGSDLSGEKWRESNISIIIIVNKLALSS